MTWYALLHFVILGTLIFCCLDCTVPHPLSHISTGERQYRVSGHSCILAWFLQHVSTASWP
jgi:hypothetical protein